MDGGGGTGCGSPEFCAHTAVVRAMERAAKRAAAMRRRTNEYGTPILQNSAQHCTPADCAADEAQCFMGRTEFVVGSDRRRIPPKSCSRKCAATELRSRCDLLEARFAGALKKALRAETTVCASLSTKSLSRQDYCADPSEQATPTAEAQSSIPVSYTHLPSPRDRTR